MVRIPHHLTLLMVSVLDIVFCVVNATQDTSTALSAPFEIVRSHRPKLENVYLIGTHGDLLASVRIDGRALFRQVRAWRTLFGDAKNSQVRLD